MVLLQAIDFGGVAAHGGTDGHYVVETPEIINQVET
jgi:hypothetical protein